MTTATATPNAPTKRPRRARRRKAKQVTEQPKVVITEDTTEKRVKPDVELLSNEVILKDLKNRWLLIKYESAELFDDATWLFRKVKSFTKKLIERIKSVEL